MSFGLDKSALYSETDTDKRTHMKFRVHIDPERCKGCGLCVPFCAKGLLRMSARLNAAGHPIAEMTDEDACSGCANCAVLCPEAGIEIEAATKRKGGKTE